MNETTDDAIEVTPAMVEAGVAAITKWLESYGDFIADAYVAMERERRKAGVFSEEQRKVDQFSRAFGRMAVTDTAQQERAWRLVERLLGYFES